VLRHGVPGSLNFKEIRAVARPQLEVDARDDVLHIQNPGSDMPSYDVDILLSVARKVEAVGIRGAVIHPKERGRESSQVDGPSVAAANAFELDLYVGDRSNPVIPNPQSSEMNREHGFVEIYLKEWENGAGRIKLKPRL
jgi:hypothetical protein